MAIADIVEGIISAQQSYADGALSTASGALETLGGMDFTYTTYGEVGPPTYGVNQMVQPSPLTELSASALLGGKPEQIVVEPVERPPSPSIVMPARPTVVMPTVPYKPSITAPVSGIDGVTLGDLMTYIIPEKPPISLPSYDIEVPVTLSITPVEHFFSVDTFSFLNDPLIESIRNRLNNNIRYGGTGLASDIEESIWNRGLEREERQLSDTVDKAFRTWATRGFSLPDGPLADSIASLQQAYADRRIDSSREIAIKQAELEQSNIFKSMELGVSLVGKVIEAMVEYDKLILASQESTAKFANEFIRLQIETNNNLVDVYKAKIMAYELQLKAELAKIEIYRADIQAALGALQMNESTVKIYAVQIEAEIAKYKGSLEANNLLVQMFSEEVRSVIAQAGLEESKVKIYAEQVRGCLAQADVYKSQIEGMTAEVNAEKAKVEANVAQVEAWSKGATILIEHYKAQVERYRAEAALNASMSEVEAAFADANAKMFVGAVGANAEYAKVGQASIAAYHSMRLKAAEGVATASAHLAAGAMAAVHAQAQLASTETSKA